MISNDEVTIVPAVVAGCDSVFIRFTYLYFEVGLYIRIYAVYSVERIMHCWRARLVVSHSALVKARRRRYPHLNLPVVK